VLQAVGLVTGADLDLERLRLDAAAAAEKVVSPTSAEHAGALERAREASEAAVTAAVKLIRPDRSQ